MEWSLQRGQSRGSSWTRWVLCALLAWPAVQAYAAPSDAAMIHGPSLAVGSGHNCAIDTTGQLKCWGDTGHDLHRPPAGRYVSIASGDGFSCALRSDGEAVCWGDPAGGATTPPPGPWRSLAAGSAEACGLRPDGGLQCWGSGRNGVGATAPTGGRFIAVSMSSMGGCVIRTDGTLQCWGHPGAGGTDWSAVPPGYFTSVSVKNEHACALRSDGRVLCWGSNYYGQNDAPADAGFIAVSAGFHFGCALREDGSAVCWGYLYDGALNAPAGRFTQISAGAAHACATRLDGTAQCWGWGYEYSDGWLHEQGAAPASVAVGGGEVCVLDADGEPHCTGTIPSLQPVSGRYSQLSLGSASGCGILLGGSTACWGASLGPTPTAAMAELSVGEAHACGVQTDGAVACWGDNSFGQTDAPPGSYLTVAAGDRYSCAITTAGTVSCWGQDPLVSGVPVGNGFSTLLASKDVVCANRASFGSPECWGEGAWLVWVAHAGLPVTALGDHFACYMTGQVSFCYGDFSRGVPGFSGDEFIAMAASGGGACGISRDNRLDCSGDVQFQRWLNTMRIGTGSVATGAAHTCSTGKSGMIDCWGDNTQGQRDAPPIRARALVASGDQSCAIVGDNTLQCWGDVGRGVSLPLPGTAVRDVDVGQYNGCAVRTDGGAACWGWNVNGQSSPPAETFRRIVTGLNHSCGIREDSTLACWGYGADRQTAAPAGEFIAVDVGERHSCAITVHGLLHCWGMDGEGQATPPPGAAYRALSTGAFHNCAIRSDGALVCWGRNDKGQATPPQGRFASVSAGVAHSCAIRDDGARICWGSNDSGQSPSLVIGPETLPRAEYRQSYATRLVATGGTGASTFHVVSDALPSWMALDEDGWLHVYPEATGALDFVVEARDAKGVVGRRAYRLQVGPSSDTTPPVVTGGIIAGVIGENGWYTSDVHIRWDVSDAESGIVESDGCGETVISNDIGSAAFTCSALNRAGRKKVESRSLRRDATPPRIRAWLSPEVPNAEGWFTVPVTAAYDCWDATSGVMSDCPQSAAFPMEGVHTLPIRSIRDNAGNIATAPATQIKIDWTRPQLSATMPPAQLLVGATHDFQLNATDAVSGIASQRCTPIDTSPPSVSDTGSGLRVATCTAIDRAGNSTSVSAVYLVVYPTRRIGGAALSLPQNMPAPPTARRAPMQPAHRSVKPAKPRVR